MSIKVPSENVQRKIMRLLDSLFAGQQNLWKKIEDIEKTLEGFFFIDKIRELEREKAILVEEINVYKKEGEKKAQNLKNEVTSLKKEVNALKKLLNK